MWSVVVAVRGQVPGTLTVTALFAATGSFRLMKLKIWLGGGCGGIERFERDDSSGRLPGGATA